MSGMPIFLELRSKSDTGELPSSKLGLYHLTSDTREEGKSQGPVYCQDQNGDKKQKFLYRWNSTAFDYKIAAVS